MIFKLQQSIPAGQRLLLYDKSQRHLTEIDMPDEIAVLMGDRPKIFAEGKIDAQGVFQIDKRALRTPAVWPERHSRAFLW